MMGLLGGFGVIAVVLVGLLAELQAVNPERYVERGEDQRTRTYSLSGYRGSIVDRDGFVLALSTPGFGVVADPSLVEDAAATANLLSGALGLPVDQVQLDLLGDSPDDRYAMVSPEIDEAAVAALDALFADDANDDTLTGIYVVRHEDRVYPNGSLARPVIGGVDPDERGTFGIEWQYDQEMQGRAGEETIERGIFGSITGGIHEVDPAVQGDDIVLTLDHRIQYVVEQSLIEHCEDTLAQGAQAVVSDPRTGEILAMGTVVRNENGTCSVPNHNAPLIETFEPGSVLKVVTAAAAVEELGMSGDTLIEVPKKIEVGDVWFEEHGVDHVAAPYPVDQIISQSMNVGTIRLAEQLGRDMLYEYLMGFGFSQPTGLEFRGEARGTVHDPADWYGSDLGSIPIGQGMTTNAVQLNSAYNVIANGGLYVAPTLVRTAVSPDGTERVLAQQPSRRVLSDTTASEVTDMLVGVVEHPTGTGSAAAVPGYSVAGKTGTAWKVFREFDGAPLTYGEPGNRRYVVSFAGFLPAENPQLSITVVVDEPITETSAGLVAAPVFSDIAQYSLRILGIPPGTIEQATPGDQDSLVRGTPAEDPLGTLSAAPPTDGHAIVPEEE